MLRNLPTSSLRRLLSLDSDCAAERTCDEADPVSLGKDGARVFDLAVNAVIDLGLLLQKLAPGFSVKF